MPKKKSGLTVEDRINEKFGTGTIASLGKNRSRDTEVTAVPTELPSVDNATHVGGIPQGRMIELFAPESMGKTTLAAWIVKQHLDYIEKKKVAFIDVEHALDPHWISKVTGMDFDDERIFVSQPDYGEQALEIAKELILSGEYSIVVIDSVASLIPKSELEGNFADKRYAERARLLSQACPQFAAMCSKTETTLLWINQVRTKIGVFFGDNTDTPGGMSLKFYCSMRIELMPAKGSMVRIGDRVIGRKIKMTIVKNKVGIPFRTGIINFDFEIGIDQAKDVMIVGLEKKVLVIKDSKKKGKGCIFFGKYNLGKHDKELTKFDREAVAKHIEDILEGING